MNMAKKLKYLVIHCTATHAGQEVEAKTIEQWHMGPCDLPNGRVLYKGKEYARRSLLPQEKVGGVDIINLKGRGWSRTGYSCMIHLNGLIQVLNHFNDDAVVDEWEITNGVAGINSVSRHIVYVGGLEKDSTTPADTRTPSQRTSLELFVKEKVLDWPDILIAGHHQFDPGKACPSFDVPAWCASIGIPSRNIYLHK